MFFRTKKSGPRTYLQIVDNRWVNGGVKQHVVATLDRLEELQRSGQIEALIASGARFTDAVLLSLAHCQGQLAGTRTRRIGPALVFERLWSETGCRKVMEGLLAERQYALAVERAIFLTVLHRLFDPGSDRAAGKCRRHYRIAGAEDLQLHRLYQALAWLGDPLPQEQQRGKTRAPRCLKDLIDEALFAHRRELFSFLDVVFFYITSTYFEGAGGESLGRWGRSEDHRPDLRQLVVGVVLDRLGRPICCELWPGNTSDVKSVIPIVDRLRQRSSIGRICIVADRGMISRKMVSQLQPEVRRWLYILGARLRADKEVRTKVLAGSAAFELVRAKSSIRKDPAPLQIKEVKIGTRRYVVCFNEDQGKKDAADRKAIVASLREQIKQGTKSLLGNKGYPQVPGCAAGRFGGR